MTSFILQIVDFSRHEISARFVPICESARLKLSVPMIPSLPPVYTNFILKTVLAFGAGLLIAGLL